MMVATRTGLAIGRWVLTRLLLLPVSWVAFSLRRPAACIVAAFGGFLQLKKVPRGVASRRRACGRRGGRASSHTSRSGPGQRTWPGPGPEGCVTVISRTSCRGPSHAPEPSLRRAAPSPRPEPQALGGGAAAPKGEPRAPRGLLSWLAGAPGGAALRAARRLSLGTATQRIVSARLAKCLLGEFSFSCFLFSHIMLLPGFNHFHAKRKGFQCKHQRRANHNCRKTTKGKCYSDSLDWPQELATACKNPVVLDSQKIVHNIPE